jgi:hypothetical protein
MNSNGLLSSLLAAEVKRANATDEVKEKAIPVKMSAEQLYACTVAKAKSLGWYTGYEPPCKDALYIKGHVRRFVCSTAKAGKVSLADFMTFSVGTDAYTYSMGIEALIMGSLRLMDARAIRYKSKIKIAE